MSKEFAAALGEVASKRQLTIVGDLHINLDALKTMADPENFAELKKANVKHLFLEVPSEFQRQYDYLLRGQIDDSEFVRRLERKVYNPHLSLSETSEYWKEHIKMVRGAHANGIKVYAADLRGNIELDYGKEFSLKGAGKYDEVASYVDDVYRRRMPDGTTASPLNDDRPLAKFIQDKAGKEGAVYYGGLAHGKRSYDLDEAFGQEKTARIEIYSGKVRKAFEDVLEWRDRRSDVKPDPDPAAFIFYSSSNQVDWQARPEGPVREAEPAGPQKPEKSGAKSTPKRAVTPSGP